MAIHFSSTQAKLPLKKRKLKQFLTFSFGRFDRKPGDVHYQFCNDAFIKNINNNFLQHNYPTDIITFPLSEGEIIHADILISYETVFDNALTYHVSYEYELHRVIFHGLLHLVGYNDKSKREQTLMRKAEDEMLKQYFS